VAIAGAVSAAIDLRTRRVPNPATLLISGVGLSMAATDTSNVSLTGALAGFVVGFMLMLPGHIVGATGAGDVKLMAALGTLLGPAGIVTAFLYTALAGGLLAVLVAMWRRRLGASVGRLAALVRSGGDNVHDIEGTSVNNRFAYAPAIAVGTLAVALGF
jgi:prepilin peptidase CpaA